MPGVDTLAATMTWVVWYSSYPLPNGELRTDTRTLGNPLAAARITCYAIAQAMRIRYSSEAAAMVIELNQRQPVDFRDLAEGVILHLSRSGQPVEIEVLDVSRVVGKRDLAAFSKQPEFAVPQLESVLAGA